MSPFDAARYARLLKGLEISEVSWSYANTNNDILRIDGEYFQKQHLIDESLRRKRNYCSLGGMGAQVRSFGAYSLNNEVEYLEAGVPFIRGVNMKGGRVTFSDMLYIRKEAHELLWKSEVKEGMILLSMSGTIGDVAIATASWPYPINSNQDIAKIDTKGACSPYVLYAFLLSRYGQGYLRREARGSVQQHVFLSQIEQLEVPVFGAKLVDSIKDIIERSDSSHVQKESELRVAESVLLRSLGMENWQAPEPLSYVRQSSDAFMSGRLDAQHFQPRFKALTDFIDATGQGARLGDWLSENQRGKQPQYAADGLQVVNSKHVLRGEVRLDEGNRYATFSDEDLLIHQGDVLMNGTGVGTIGRAAPYLHADAAVPDNHVTILRPLKGLDAVYLSVFLNSMAGQWQVEQRLRGSSGQIELYPNDIAQFRVWLAPASVQAKIRRAVEKSHEQKQLAAQFLDAAKRAIEIAIEDGEAKAISFLGKFK